MSGSSKPPAAWLQQLHDAGQWQRLIDIACRSLEVDPLDAETHHHLAWAYLRVRQPEKMRPHVEFLLAHQPEEADTYQLAALCETEAGCHAKALEFAQVSLGLNPHLAALHHTAAIILTRQNQIAQARHHLALARAMEPENVRLASFDLALQTSSATTYEEIWEALRRWEALLAFDPENDEVHARLGDCFLSLDKPAEAIEAYSRALALDPLDKEHQQSLRQALKARHFMYRVLRAPFSAWEYFRRGFASPAALVCYVIGFKGLLIFLAWLVVSMVIFGPASWLYEGIMLADIRHARATASPRFRRWLPRLYDWPVWARWALFLVLFGGTWALVFRLFGGLPGLALRIIIILFTVQFVLCLVFHLLRRHKISAAQRRRPHQEQPPPLPPPRPPPPSLPPSRSD